ncbi:MAG: MAPEG family protein [Methyloceanibacter sp.]
MSMQAMLMPVFAQVALTFALLFWMSILRIQAIRQGKVAPHAVALREPNWPPRATQIGNAYHNQLETPLLFYALILLALETRTADSILLVLSWLFVVSRFVHAYIHITSNRIDRRGPVFLVGAIGLALMWIIVAARLTIASSG